MSQLLGWIVAPIPWFVASLFRLLNRVLPWWRLPRPLAVLNLWALRTDLRRHNLHDTSGLATEPPPAANGAAAVRRRHDWRSDDGTGTDVADPTMGAAMTRFARQAPLDDVWPDKGKPTYPDDRALLDPSPREVSRQLMGRKEFKPAQTLNLLAAAWIQFENHDWFAHVLQHARTPDRKPVPLADGDVFKIPLAADDDWPEDQRVDGKMLVTRTPKDMTRKRGSLGPPTFLNEVTHWWDGSQLYGSSRERQMKVRELSGGRLKVVDGRLPPDPQENLKNGIDLTGFNDNYWVGLSFLHTLFAKEHNAICAMLAAKHPEWDDEELFQKARLANAALTAKIHTVEWTPGILATPALETAMNANWWGLLGEAWKRRFGRLTSSETLSGIPGSPVDHHSAPYYLSEEFVSVYRLHALIPDEITFRDLEGRDIVSKPFDAVQGVFTRPLIDQVGMTNLAYTLGTAHPGAVTIGNFPQSLRRFERADGQLVDVAAVDILRDRERGVPRYNDFLRMVRKQPLVTFGDLTDDKDLAARLASVYGNDVEKIDLQIGLGCEKLPPGFGFSDTAFRVFILMASRRLKSDRFLSQDFRPEVYTQEGIDWVNDNSMKSVLLRHHPELEPALRSSKNAFAPWQR